MKNTLSAIAPLVLAGVGIRVTNGTVSFSGVLAMRDPSDTITPFLKQVHLAAIESGTRRLMVDLTDLKFMNSSSIRSLVDWIEWIRQEEPPKQYVIHFKMKSDVTWQITTMDAIQCLGGKYVAVEGGTHGYVDQPA